MGASAVHVPPEQLARPYNTPIDDLRKFSFLFLSKSPSETARGTRLAANANAVCHADDDLQMSSKSWYSSERFNERLQTMR